MVNVTQIEKGLASYIDAEFMPHVHLPQYQQVAIGACASILVKRVGIAINNLKSNPLVTTLGIVDASGNVDIDILAEEFKKKMPPEGLKVPIPILGEIVLHPSDIDTLYRKISGGNTK